MLYDGWIVIIILDENLSKINIIYTKLEIKPISKCNLQQHSNLMRKMYNKIDPMY